MGSLFEVRLFHSSLALKVLNKIIPYFSRYKERVFCYFQTSITSREPHVLKKSIKQKQQNRISVKMFYLFVYSKNGTHRIKVKNFLFFYLVDEIIK